ncbi:MULTISPECIES: aminotransferase family protein [Micrococcaceae]|jgi:adenosylmethionine-8-amino-7-oxononanoate aminotransferase|nr:aminotransferase class III-fold pyridoxal phosphate-dependent enzyme [Arthrobacter sp. H16F315]MDD1478735.1 aminotransferase class III-fold pyridoxal phosphate-dependent enzyme [Arthrobacter sp. H16F315]MDD1478783.1 aminotransferase class III-fold pyridoxal phosphate-dependent enzyme [Arthrobacter sp. H16F315]
MSRQQALWSAQAHMPTVLANEPTVIVEAHGAYITTDKGERYLDGAGGLWYANVGHGREEIAEVAAAQMKKLETWHVFGRYLNDRAVELAEKIAALAPIVDPKVILTSGGSDSVDMALKLARRHWQLQEKFEKLTIVSRHNSYHGLHAFGTSVAGLEFNRVGHGPGPLIPDTLLVDPFDIDLVEKTIRDFGGERIAAFIAEPVMGTGGLVPPPAGYFKRIKELAAEYDFLVVADEVITGFGRLGTWFASERFDIQPDMITFAKGITSGYMPLGGVLVAPKIWKQFFEGQDAPILHQGLTYSGHATAAAVALKNLEILEREDLLGRVRSLEPILAQELESLRGTPGVQDVRYVGLMGGVDLAPGISGVEVVAEMERRGVHLRNLPNDILMISPPFIVTQDELRLIVSTIRDSLSTVLSRH